VQWGISNPIFGTSNTDTGKMLQVFAGITGIFLSQNVIFLSQNVIFYDGTHAIGKNICTNF
jgi:hypothetical protein